MEQIIIGKRLNQVCGLIYFFIPALSLHDHSKDNEVILPIEGMKLASKTLQREDIIGLETTQTELKHTQLDLVNYIHNKPGLAYDRSFFRLFRQKNGILTNSLLLERTIPKYISPIIKALD